MERLLRGLLGMVVVGGGGFFIRTWVGFAREGSDMHMGGLHTHMGVSSFIGFMGFILVLHGIRGSLRLWVHLWLGLPAECFCMRNAEFLPEEYSFV